MVTLLANHSTLGTTDSFPPGSPAPVMRDCSFERRPKGKFLSMVTTRKMSRLDPACVLGPDVMLLVFRHLSASDLVTSAMVSKHWSSLVNEDVLWRSLSQVLWQGMVYVPAAGCGSLSWRQRYAVSLVDRGRTSITVEELCTFPWTFRFKRAAGQYWMNLDPYWTKQGGMMRRHFHEEGAVSTAPEDPLWGEFENRWRFTKSKEGVRGHYVKINHWPSLRISRGSNWGWRMENCWVVYEAELEEGGPYCQGVPHA